MSPIPSGDQYVQFLYETTTQAEAGGAVATTAFYHPNRSFNLGAAPITDDRSDEFRGTPEPIAPDVIGWNAPEGSTSSRIYPNTLGVYMIMALGTPTTTAGAASGVTDPDAGTIPVGATRHVWDSSTLDYSTVKTFQSTFFYGNNTGYWLRAKGVSVPTLTLNVGGRDEPSTMDADLQGLYMARLASDPTLTPTYDAVTIMPLYRGQFSVPTWLSGSAPVTGASFTFENPFEVDDTLGGSLWPPGWQRPITAGAVPRLRGQMTLRTVDPDDHDAFFNNTSFTYKSKWISSQNIGATTYKYSLWIEGAGKYEDYNPDEMQHQLRHGATVPFVAGKSGATQAFKVTLVNGVTSYTTP